MSVLTRSLCEPCADCPFLARMEHGFTTERLVALIGEGVFPCHKTAVVNDLGMFVEGPDSMACAGALIFQLKAERPNQMTRILLRTGFNPEVSLNLDAPVREWDGAEDGDG